MAVYEVLNAVTMIPSPCILYARAVNFAGLLACSAIATQVPFSIVYHSYESFKISQGIADCRIDNHLRRMDQTMQHIAQIVLTYAITQSVLYTEAIACFHCVACVQLWHPSTTNDGKRWCMVAIGVCAYTLPLLLKHQFIIFSYAVFPMVIGCVFAFVPAFKFNGAHALMHVGGWMHADAIGIILSTRHDYLNATHEGHPNVGFVFI